MDDHLLRERLLDLTDRMDSPAPVAADLAADLGRGRRRATRRRAALGAAALTVAAVAGVGAVVLPGGGDQGASRPADQDGTAGDGKELLVAVRAAVARHLDPEGVHISGREITMAPGSAEGGVSQSLVWTNPGERGRGQVVVEVLTQVPAYDCGASGGGLDVVTCTPDDLAGVAVTRVDSLLGTTWVHTRADGYVTTIRVEDEHEDYARGLETGIEVSDAQLAAVLTDPALDILGHPEPTERVDRLPGTLLRDVARSVLGDEVDGPESWSGDDLGTYTVHRNQREAEAFGSGYLTLTEGWVQPGMDETCASTPARPCEARVVDGRLVRVDYWRSGPDGFDVAYVGPERTVSVQVRRLDGERAIPVDLAIELVTDPRLQR